MDSPIIIQLFMCALFATGCSSGGAGGGKDMVEHVPPVQLINTVAGGFKNEEFNILVYEMKLYDNDTTTLRWEITDKNDKCSAYTQSLSVANGLSIAKTNPDRRGLEYKFILQNSGVPESCELDKSKISIQSFDHESLLKMSTVGDSSEGHPFFHISNPPEYFNLSQGQGWGSTQISFVDPASSDLAVFPIFNVVNSEFTGLVVTKNTDSNYSFNKSQPVSIYETRIVNITVSENDKCFHKYNKELSMHMFRANMFPQKYLTFDEIRNNGAAGLTRVFNEKVSALTQKYSFTKNDVTLEETCSLKN